MKKLFLSFVYVFVLFHFLKDVAQDILKLPCIFDGLYDVKEDLGHLPIIFTYIFNLFSYLSYLGELVLLFIIPINIENNFKHKSLNVVMWFLIIYLCLYFILSISLDPNIKNILLI